MRKTLRVLNISLLFTLLPAAGSAQNLGAICEAVTRLAPGQWVEYELSGGQMGAAGPASMWMGHTGTTSSGGVDHVIYEWRMTGPQTVTMQMTVTENSGPWDMQHVVEMKVQLPGQAPMVMTGSMLEMAKQNSQAPNIAEECHNAEVIGNESITVPAGTMRTLHMRHEQGEVWASTDVPLALVKFVSSDGMSMQLKAHGDGATSSMN